MRVADRPWLRGALTVLRLPAHEATTAQLGSAYPFASAPPLRTGRVLVGRDLAGGAFLHDPSPSTPLGS